MALVPYDPFRQLDQWRRDLDKYFNFGLGINKEWSNPRMDIHETENEVVAACEIPGLTSKEDVNIDIDGDMLAISGTVNRSHEVKEEQMHRQERFTGRFQRTVALPARVHAEGTTASYRNGILEVRMPKQKNEAKKRIDVQFH